MTFMMKAYVFLFLITRRPNTIVGLLGLTTKSSFCR